MRKEKCLKFNNKIATATTGLGDSIGEASFLIELSPILFQTMPLNLMCRLKRICSATNSRINLEE
jgi:hypothetical protein